MPAVAVVGAALGGAALAEAAVAATWTLTAMETIAAVGSVIGGLGVITENKDLAKIGGVMSLAGGVGAFMQGKFGSLAEGVPSAAGETAVSSAAEQASNIGAIQETISGAAPAAELGQELAAAPVAEGMSNAGSVVQQSIQSAPVSGAVEAGVQSGANLGGAAESATRALGEVGATGAEGVGVGMAAPRTGLLADAGQGLRGSLAADLANAPSAASSFGIQSPSLAALNTTANGGIGAVANNSRNIFDTLKDWANVLEKNKTLTTIGAQFVGAAFDPSKKVLEDRAKAEKDLYDARAATERTQLANMNAMPGINIRPGQSNLYGNTPYQSPASRGILSAAGTRRA